MPARGQYIAGRWVSGSGPTLEAHDPATGQVIYQGPTATSPEIEAAVAVARQAQPAWAARPLTERMAHLQAFAAALQKDALAFAETISLSMGKPLWESRQEVDAMINKVKLAGEAHAERCRTVSRKLGEDLAAIQFRPYGVVAVLGPFNFPGHLPNGHIVPALLAGNTVVFKPSELTPAVGQRMSECWEAAGLPPGVLNLLQGGRETGSAVARHPDLDGLFFTGSAAAGRALQQAFVDRPGKILALEMGGNNPLVVWQVTHTDAAAYLALQSAFLTTGQRCSCARRLIVAPDASTDAFVERLLDLTRRLQVGPYTQRPEPFMGPVISSAAATQLMQAQELLVRRGATILLPMKRQGTFLTPGLVDVTAVTDRPDEEFFGPLLQIIRVPTFAHALAEANRTHYGLTAALLSAAPALWEPFYHTVRAGVINFNRPTTGASSAQPFGGLGRSGNLRPSGYFAADYCSYPVASLERPALALPETLSPGVPSLETPRHP